MCGWLAPQGTEGVGWSALSRLVKRAAFLAMAVAVLYAASAAFGAVGAVLASVALFGGSVLLLLVLPRAGHRAFQRGAFRRAAFMYRLLGRLRLDGEVRAA